MVLVIRLDKGALFILNETFISPLLLINFMLQFVSQVFAAMKLCFERCDAIF